MKPFVMEFTAFPGVFAVIIVLSFSMLVLTQSLAVNYKKKPAAFPEGTAAVMEAEAGF